MSLELFQQRVPVVSMLFSPGFLFWVYAAGIVFSVRCGRFRQAAAFLPAELNWLTVLLGPTSLVRYVLIFWFALPVLALVVSRGKLCYTEEDNANFDDTDLNLRKCNEQKAEKKPCNRIRVLCYAVVLILLAALGILTVPPNCRETRLRQDLRNPSIRMTGIQQVFIADGGYLEKHQHLRRKMTFPVRW